MTTSLWRMGVPVATPVNLRDFLAAASALVSRRDLCGDFQNRVRGMLGVGYARATNSGRSALFVTLQAMKRIKARAGARDEVVIPAFVCPSVGRAVVKAGLKPVLCDVGPSGSGLDLDALNRVLGPSTLAVVTAHLYGYPTEVSGIAELSHSAGALVIEDAAQAFGAQFGGRYTGTCADAGVFSFGMSKVLWSMGGGLIVTSDSELMSHIGEIIAGFPRPNRMREAVKLGKFVLLSMLIRSHYLGPADAIWSTALRGKDDCKDFDARAWPASHSALAGALLSRLGEITQIRKRNAAYLTAALAGLPGINLPEISQDSESVCLRFPVVVHDPVLRRTLITALRREGVNTSEMYARDSYDALRGFAACDSECPRAVYLTQRMLNLPTHAYLQERDLHAIAAVFDSILGRRQAVTEECESLASAQ